MVWTQELKQFIADHLQDDTAKLLLAAHRFPQIDVPFAVVQIEARRRLKNKLPEWYANSDLIMGGRVPAEQCSSEQTARYKRSLLDGCHSLCDMTGGMGVDFWYMSRGMDHAIYTECQQHLCEAARHNFMALEKAEKTSRDVPSNVTTLEVREGLSTELPIPDVDAIYLDPARRSDVGSRIYEIEDCLPNVIAWQDQLLTHCKRLITKVSPMADIRRTLQRLKGVCELHVVSVRNECKELLIVQHSPQEYGAAKDIKIFCVDFLSDRQVTFQFALKELQGTLSVPLVAGLDDVNYLYEPDVSLMKAQAFSPISQRYPVMMLDANTHLFASSSAVPDFPGRAFKVEEKIEFSSRQLKQLKKRIPQANLATRNFPMSADELRSRTGIRDGGSVYLYGCQINNAGSWLLVCRKDFE